jgi:hypothetical protein
MMTMAKIPNNPMQAYMMGKRDGTKENMDMIAMALLDKLAWHVLQENPEDKNSIEWLFNQLIYYAEEINSGRIKRRDIKDVLLDEQNMRFVD